MGGGGNTEGGQEGGHEREGKNVRAFTLAEGGEGCIFDK